MEARVALWVEVERLAAQESLTILLTTPYLEEADRLAERVAIVSRGKVVVEGTPAALKADLRGELVTIDLADANGRVEAASAVGSGAGRRVPAPAACRDRDHVAVRDVVLPLVPALDLGPTVLLSKEASRPAEPRPGAWFG